MNQPYGASLRTPVQTIAVSMPVRSRETANPTWDRSKSTGRDASRWQGALADASRWQGPLADASRWQGGFPRFRL